jgi:hypothetical protein
MVWVGLLDVVSTPQALLVLRQGLPWVNPLSFWMLEFLLVELMGKKQALCCSLHLAILPISHSSGT